MCFSASASFIAGGGLVALGGASLIVAKKEKKILAAIPFLFGIQQLAESFQWLQVNAHHTSPLAAYFFLFFAFIVWPLYVPVSILLLDTKRRQVLWLFVVLGVIVASYFSWLLLTQNIMVSNVNACIRYSFYFPYEYPVLLLYIVAIFGSLFVSTVKPFRWFGVITFALGLVSWFFYRFAFTSVWCFFAAIVSTIFFIYLYKPKLLSFDK